MREWLMHLATCGARCRQLVSKNRRRRFEIKHRCNDEQSKHRSEADADLEREIREGRKFTLEEAIARMVGPGAMKGESPVTRKEQAEAEIDNFLRRYLTD